MMKNRREKKMESVTKSGFGDITPNKRKSDGKHRNRYGNWVSVAVYRDERSEA